MANPPGSLTISESTDTFSVALSKDFYGERLYYNNADSNLNIQHGLAAGTISLGYFGTNTAYVHVSKTSDDRSLLKASYGTFSKNLAIQQNASITGSALIGTDLTVGGSGSVSGNFAVGTSATITGYLAVGSNVAIGSSLSIGTDLTVGGQSSLTGDLSVGSNATISKNLYVSTNSYVYGSSSITGNLSVGSSTTISGQLNVGTNLIVGASITGTALTITGPFASVTGDVAVGSSLIVAQSASISGSASITGNLLVHSSASISANLAVGTDAFVLGAASITGNLNVASSAIIGTNLTVGSSASVTNNVFVNGTLVSRYGSITNLTAGNAIIMNNLIVEGKTDYMNTSVSTLQDLQIELGLGETRRVTAFSAGSPGTFSLDGTGDGTVSVIPVGSYAILTNLDQFTASGGTGYEPILEVLSSTLSGGTYSVTFQKHDGGSISSVNNLAAVGLTANFDFDANIISLGQVADGSLYGQPGLSFNTYSTISAGTLTNSTRNMYFTDYALNVYRSNSQVIDLNLKGTARNGTADTPYFAVNNKQLLNPNNLIVDTTFATNSAIYLNADSTTTQNQGTWRMKVTPNGRITFQMMKSNGVWTPAFSIAPP